MHIKYLFVERSGILDELNPDNEDNKRITKTWVEYLKAHEQYAVNPDKKKKKKKAPNLELYFS
jgi:acetyl-CoA carboxylase carboxyltransferase component